MPETIKAANRPPVPYLVSDNTGAALLGISRATFWRRVNDGTLPQPIKLGGATRWRRDEIEAVIEALAADRSLRAVHGAS